MKLIKILTCVPSYGIVVGLFLLGAKSDSQPHSPHFPAALSKQVNKLIPSPTFASASDNHKGLTGISGADEETVSKNLVEVANLKDSDSKKNEIETNESNEGESKESVSSEEQKKGEAKGGNSISSFLYPPRWEKYLEESSRREAKQRRLLSSLAPYHVSSPQSYHEEEEKDTLPLATVEKREWHSYLLRTEQSDREEMKGIFHLSFRKPKTVRGLSYLYPKARAMDIEIGEVVNAGLLGVVFRIKIKGSTKNLLGKFAPIKESTKQYCDDLRNRMALLHQKFTEVNPNLLDFSAQSNIFPYLDIIRLYGIFDTDPGMFSFLNRLLPKRFQNLGTFYRSSLEVDAGLYFQRGYHDFEWGLCFDLYVMEEYSQSIEGIIEESMIKYSVMKQLSRATKTLHRLNMSHNNVRTENVVVSPTGKVCLAHLDGVSFYDPSTSENSDTLEDGAIIFDALLEELRNEKGKNYESSKLQNQQRQNQIILGLSNKSELGEITSGHLSPLTFQGKRNDIMSLGAVFYELVCGKKLPVSSSDAFQSPKYENCVRQVLARDRHLIGLILQKETYRKPTDQQIWRMFAIADIMQKACPTVYSHEASSTSSNSIQRRKPTLCNLQKHLYISLGENFTSRASLPQEVVSFESFLTKATMEELEGLWLKAKEYLETIKPQMLRGSTDAS